MPGNLGRTRVRSPDLPFLRIYNHHCPLVTYWACRGQPCCAYLTLCTCTCHTVPRPPPAGSCAAHPPVSAPPCMHNLLPSGPPAPAALPCAACTPFVLPPRTPCRRARPCTRRVRARSRQ